MTLLDLFLYTFVAFAGGVVNSVAGGGTFLTFPMLMLGGLSALQANIMSTIAMWPGAVSSAVAYRKEFDLHKKQMVNLLLVSMVGSSVGTMMLLVLPEVIFEQLVPWLLLFATVILALGGKLKIPGYCETHGMTGLGYLFQFIIAVYGGYFGAGIGILMLAMLQLAGFTHMHQMNALKTILSSAINAVAVMIFIFSGKVIWSIAVFMIAGGIAGGYVGARVALRISPQKVRMAVVFIGFCMTSYFFLRAA